MRVAAERREETAHLGRGKGAFRIHTGAYWYSLGGFTQFFPTAEEAEAIAQQLLAAGHLLADRYRIDGSIKDIEVRPKYNGAKAIFLAQCQYRGWRVRKIALA